MSLHDLMDTRIRHASDARDVTQRVPRGVGGDERGVPLSVRRDAAPSSTLHTRERRHHLGAEVEQRRLVRVDAGAIGKREPAIVSVIDQWGVGYTEALDDVLRVIRGAE